MVRFGCQVGVVPIETSWKFDLSLEDLLVDVERILGEEGRVAREHLVDDDPEGPPALARARYVGRRRHAAQGVRKACARRAQGVRKACAVTPCAPPRAAPVRAAPRAHQSAPLL